MFFTDIVSEKDIIEFVHRMAWKTTRFETVYEAVDGSARMMAIFPKGLGETRSEENEDSVMLEFASRKILARDHRVFISKTAQKAWREWVKVCRRRAKRRRPVVI